MIYLSNIKQRETGRAIRIISKFVNTAILTEFIRILSQSLLENVKCSQLHLSFSRTYTYIYINCGGNKTYVTSRRIVVLKYRTTRTVHYALENSATRFDG